MKKFFISCLLISVTGALLFHYLFYYSWIVLLYHLTVVIGLMAVVLFLNILIAALPYPGAGRILLNLVNGFFFFGLVNFYIATLASNALWGKTITLKIYFDYIVSLSDLVAVLPIESWIFYLALLILLVILGVVFWLIRPHYGKLHQQFGSLLKNRKIVQRFLGAVTILLILWSFFIHAFLTYKRTIHFAGEPIMEFVLGPMWYPDSGDGVFDLQRQKNSLKEQDCIQSVMPVDSARKKHTTIVVLVDALRSDHLPMYGYSRMTAPFLDSLSRTGQLKTVKHAFSSSSGTLIGVAGLFGSKSWDQFGYGGLSLMKFMQRTNHTTYAFLTGHHRTWYGLTAIYRNDTKHFYESASTYSNMNLDDLTTLAKIQQTDFPENSFLYVHLLSTHALGKKSEPFRKFLPDKIGIGTDKKTALINNYDNGILQTDFFIRKLIEKFRTEGALDNFTLMVVADHGDLFGEYGEWSHASSINPVVISIPLLIYDSNPGWYKNLEAGTILDIAPTLADRLGYPVPACWDGHSLGRPATDFSLRINIENKCAIPEALLTWSKGQFQLDMYDSNKKLKKVATSPTDSLNWTIRDVDH